MSLEKCCSILEKDLTQFTFNNLIHLNLSSQIEGFFHFRSRLRLSGSRLLLALKRMVRLLPSSAS